MTSLDAFRSISLVELLAQAELLRRYDTKYLIHINQLPEIYVALSSTMSVLEHEGSRSVPYTTSYFDTDGLDTYRDHLKRRRKRFKVRTRHYQTLSDGFLEIKIKKPRGQTLKVRWQCNTSTINDVLEQKQIDLLNTALTESFYNPITEPYQRTLVTTFDRTTLFDASSLERITIDTNLCATDYATSQSVDLGRCCAIIEIKSPIKAGSSHRIFTRLGIRPNNISKYCVSLTALRPHLGGAPWRSALRLLQNSGQQ